MKPKQSNVTQGREFCDIHLQKELFADARPSEAYVPLSASELVQIRECFRRYKRKHPEQNKTQPCNSMLGCVFCVMLWQQNRWTIAFCRRAVQTPIVP